MGGQGRDQGAAMTYASQQDLIDRFGEEQLIELTDRAGDDAIDATVVTRALTDADSVINSYLAQRYSVPLTEVPQVLTIRACDIARYFLHEEHAPEAVQRRYEAAIRWLRDAAVGKASIGDDDTAPAEPSTDSGPQVDAPGRLFTKTTMQGL